MPISDNKHAEYWRQRALEADERYLRAAQQSVNLLSQLDRLAREKRRHQPRKLNFAREALRFAAWAQRELDARQEQCMPAAQKETPASRNGARGSFFFNQGAGNER